jgi:hypothetical protein
MNNKVCVPKMQENIESRLDLFFSSLDRWFKQFFEPGKQNSRGRWVTLAWLFGLYLAGILLWGYFLNWGGMDFTVHDWGEITGPRLFFLQDAVRSGQLPLHISDPFALGGVTDRFLSIPDEILSPQVFLLRFMSVGRFVFVDVCLLYSLGFLGLLWLRRRFSLSFFAVTILFLLFNFNGHILAHYSIGHATWGGYFLFPWFAVLVFNLIGGERGWGWVAKISLLLFAIFLQGSFHQYVWTLLFLGFLAFSNRKNFLTIFWGIVFSILTSMARILPPVLLVSYYANTNQYLAGYLSLSDIWASMVTVLDYGSSARTTLNTQPVRIWELTLYTGLIGGVFLLYFGIFRWLKGNKGSFLYKELAVPVFGMLILSLDSVYRIVRLIPIPLLAGERVASRIISLPFVFVLILAVIELQRWLDQANRSTSGLRIGALGLMIIACHDLWENFYTWSVLYVATTSEHIEFAESRWLVKNHSDPLYLHAIEAGCLVSFLSIVLVLFLALRHPKQSSKTRLAI